MSDWIKTNDELPVGVGHIDCYIFVNGEVIERPWNCLHECWDDRDYDDFEFSATEPSHWMYKPDTPLPPREF
tara:strand:- start:587 stop:802 length:216 start_codon:yes stop_codon:yes gene_type:complete